MDPFLHHPALRDRIRAPDTSPLRHLDLDELDRQVAELGVPADWRHPDAHREAMRARALQGRWGQDLWVFAYGSLMWDPAIHFAEVRSGRVTGYRRRFCLRTELGRGTPEQPGLMAALERGDTCDGLLFRVPPDRLDEETRILWRREFLLPAYLPLFVTAETASGPVEALTCLIDDTLPAYCPDLTDAEVAQHLATGAGFLGTNLAYVESLAANLEAVGLPDPYVLRVRDRARALAGAAGR